LDKQLHIVTHDVPWPPVHGGFVDLFYKLVALHKQGIQIHLHCFKKKTRKEEPELIKYCISVNYYNRVTGVSGVSLTTPYIVHSRNSRVLINNLKNDNFPILLEGIHCTSLLQQKEFKNRKIFVRLHNIEYIYYRELAKSEKNIFKKLYYAVESVLLKKHERSIVRKAVFLAVNEEDATVYKNKFHAEVHLLPVFIPFTEIKSHSGRGNFCLYHGNLSVNENEKAVIWLLRVFENMNISFVIAGKDPSSRIKNLTVNKANISLIISPSEVEMQKLIKEAQINILPSFNNTGIKLKLLNALYNGKHCLVNKASVAGTNLESLCTIADDESGFRQHIERLYALDFSEDQIKLRRSVLEDIYDNEKNAQKLMTLIW